MNKKRFAIMSLAAILVSTTSVACSSTPETTKTKEIVSKELNYEEVFAYKPHTPREQIVEGNETAVNTISNFIHCDVNVGEDYYVNPTIISFPASGENKNDVYRVFEAYDYDANKYSLLFLFQDDTKIVEATDVSKSYMDEACIISKDYMNETNTQNYCEGAFASHYGRGSSVFLNSESGYNLSSVWGYDQETQKVYLVWVDHECPIWKNHV